jgi:hypothetical protein
MMNTFYSPDQIIFSCVCKDECDEKMWRVVLGLANQRKKSATLIEMKPITNFLGRNPFSDALHWNPSGVKWARAGSSSP